MSRAPERCGGNRLAVRLNRLPIGRGDQGAQQPDELSAACSGCKRPIGGETWVSPPMERPQSDDSRDGPIAQSVEHRADNAGVSGAIPLRPTILIGSFRSLKNEPLDPISTVTHLGL